MQNANIKDKSPLTTTIPITEMNSSKQTPPVYSFILPASLKEQIAEKMNAESTYANQTVTSPRRAILADHLDPTSGLRQRTYKLLTTPCPRTVLSIDNSRELYVPPHQSLTEEQWTVPLPSIRPMTHGTDPISS